MKKKSFKNKQSLKIGEKTCFDRILWWNVMWLRNSMFCFMWVFFSVLFFAWFCQRSVVVLENTCFQSSERGSKVSIFYTSTLVHFHTSLLNLLCLCNCLVFWIVVFICESRLEFKVTHIAMLLKPLQLDSKSDLTSIGLILQFFGCNRPPFVNFISAWTENCKNISSKTVSWWQRIFWILSSRAMLVSF